MSDRNKLKELLMDTFLLDEEEFSFELTRQQVETWDSLGVVALSVAVEEAFSYHLKPEEATGLTSIPELMTLLTREGAQFE